MTIRTFAVAIIVFCKLVQSATAARSIVGAWDFPESHCKFPIHISAMALKNVDVDCTFTSVQRKGNAVIWTGTCKDDEGSSPQTVTAKLGANGRLSIRYSPGGNVLRNLARCR